MVHLLQKGNCFGKLTNITFANELNSIILEHFKQNPQSRSLDIKLHNFGSDWVQINHFPQEIFSGKMDCYYCVPAVFYLTTAFQENFQRPNHQKGCIILSQIWPELTFPSKTNLLEKLTNLSLVFYIPLCYITSKKSSESRS